MKLFYIIDSLQIGGAEKSILEISSRLTHFEIHVIVLFNKNPDLLNEYKTAGITIHWLNLQPSWYWWISGTIKLIIFFKKNNVKIIHAHLFKSELITRLATLFNNKLIVIGAFVNDSYSSERYSSLSLVKRMKLKFYELLDRLTAQKVKHFTSITTAIAETNAKTLCINKSRIATMYRGRNINAYSVNHPLYNSQGTFNQFVFLVVARLLYRKGYDEIINAANILKAKKYSFLIKIAGEGVDSDTIRSKVKEYQLEDVIEFLGTRKDVPTLLQQSHCFLFASHYEGQGGALVEAMLSAKPIIATRMPVFEEQVEDGVTGLLFKMKDAEDLAAKMLLVINNYEQACNMGVRARETAIDRFNIERIAQQYDEYYLSLIYNHESTSAHSKATT